MVRGPAHFDCVGKRLPDSLHDTEQAIAHGLVSRLLRYGLSAMTEHGFNVDGWACEVYTMNGDLPRSERFYCVEFINSKGGSLGIQGIAVSHGHPFLDHGLTIDRDRKTA